MKKKNPVHRRRIRIGIAAMYFNLAVALTAVVREAQCTSLIYPATEIQCATDHLPTFLIAFLLMTFMSVVMWFARELEKLEEKSV